MACKACQLKLDPPQTSIAALYGAQAVGRQPAISQTSLEVPFVQAHPAVPLGQNNLGGDRTEMPSDYVVAGPLGTNIGQNCVAGQITGDKVMIGGRPYQSFPGGAVGDEPRVPIAVVVAVTALLAAGAWWISRD